MRGRTHVKTNAVKYEAKKHCMQTEKGKCQAWRTHNKQGLKGAWSNNNPPCMDLMQNKRIYKRIKMDFMR